MDGQSEQKTAQPAVKTYKFMFSPLLIVVFCIGLALAAAGIVLTTLQFLAFLREDPSSVYGWLKFVLLYFVSIFLAVLIIAMLLRSRYTITDKELILQFGIIRTRYELKKIYSVRLFRGSNKLTVYFDDFKTNYTVIVVKDVWYEDFIQTLLSRNERIEFDFTTAEEESNWKKKK